jgi:hypothetical protein
MSPRESDELYLSETYSSSVTSAVTNKKRAVSFELIQQIREYNRVVGDNPNVRVGPPK